MALPNEEQTMLREMAHNWAQKNCPVSALRELRDSGNADGYDQAVFDQIVEMGWTGALIGEDYGGSDVGYVGMGAVLEELGRTLVAAPLIGSAVGAVSAIQDGGGKAQKQKWLPEIASGSVVAALAIDESSRHTPDNIAMAARAGDAGYTLTGAKSLVHEGGTAKLFVVAARTNGDPTDSEGISLFLVPGDSAGISRSRRQLIDSRGYADLIFDGVQVGADAILGSEGGGRALLDRVLDRVAVAVASEQLGLAQQAFDVTLDYLKTRVQFGQLIGGFQALQHRAAIMFSDIQMAKVTVEAALFALDEGAEDAPAMSSLAKATANELAHKVSREMIQMHGGIGMTDAYDAGFFIKRARTLEPAYGSSAYHRDRYGVLAGI